MLQKFKKKTNVDPKTRDQQNVLNKKLKNSLIKEKLAHLKNRHYLRNETFPKNRGYKEYNFAFRNLLDGRPLFKYINKRFKGKKQISILDEGAGLARFLKEIKDLFLKKGKKIETTAITLTPGVLKENTPHLNYLHKKESQQFMPNKKYDVILSLFGGFHYNIKELDRNTVLKFAHSLSENGVMFIGINRFGSERYEASEKVFLNLKRAFEKNGFTVKYKYDIENATRKLPFYIFRIERLK